MFYLVIILIDITYCDKISEKYLLANCFFRCQATVLWQMKRVHEGDDSQIYETVTLEWGDEANDDLALARRLQAEEDLASQKPLGNSKILFNIFSAKKTFFAL